MSHNRLPKILPVSVANAANLLFDQLKTRLLDARDLQRHPDMLLYFPHLAIYLLIHKAPKLAEPGTKQLV